MDFRCSLNFGLEFHLNMFLNCGGQSGCHCHLLHMGAHVWMQTRSGRGMLHFSSMKAARLPSLHFTASLKKKKKKVFSAVKTKPLLCSEDKTSGGVGLSGGEAVSCEVDISSSSFHMW